MLSLGAINKITSEYTHPKFAKKHSNLYVQNVKRI